MKYKVSSEKRQENIWYMCIYVRPRERECLGKISSEKGVKEKEVMLHD